MAARIIGENTYGVTQIKAMAINGLVRIRLGPRRGTGGTRTIDLELDGAAHLVEQLGAAMMKTVRKQGKGSK